MKTVKNKEAGSHSECQQNVLWYHEFWRSLVPLCLAKSISEELAALVFMVKIKPCHNPEYLI